IEEEDSLHSISSSSFPSLANLSTISLNLSLLCAFILDNFILFCFLCTVFIIFIQSDQFFSFIHFLVVLLMLGFISREKVSIQFWLSVIISTLLYSGTTSITRNIAAVSAL